MESAGEANGVGAIRIVKRRDSGDMPVASLQRECKLRPDRAAADEANAHPVRFREHRADHLTPSTLADGRLLHVRNVLEKSNGAHLVCSR